MTEQAVNREDKTAATESPCLAQAPTTANPRHSISSAIARHIRFEKASFHTPGHKGRQDQLFQPGFRAASVDTWPPKAEHKSSYLSAHADLTELPGLDDLSAPTGVIAYLEERIARLWQSQGQAFISVGGASAALTAAILSAAPRGEYALVPRNAHRSVINALCLARLKPIWYEPKFEGGWGFWGAATAPALQSAIEQARSQAATIACALVVSPTYAGALSDIDAISEITKSFDIPLIVDEAHGAHFLPGCGMPRSAITSGADAVAHSWHKTLPALTQTGALHLPNGSLLQAQSVRSSLNLITSSSPSYLLLASMDETLSLLESKSAKNQAEKILRLSSYFRQGLARQQALHCYDTDSGINPSHILVGTGQEEAHHLYEFLQDRGIFAEAVMGCGVLFMLGLGSEAADIDLALAAINDFVGAYELTLSGQSFAATTAGGNAAKLTRPYKFVAPPFEPVLPPHQAMLLPHETVPLNQALGRVAAQCLSPCPPGIPILIPGQKITEEVLELISDRTIVVLAQ